MESFRHVDAPVELGPVQDTTATTEEPTTTSAEAASTVSTGAGEGPGADPALVAVAAL